MLVRRSSWCNDPVSSWHRGFSGRVKVQLFQRAFVMEILGLLALFVEFL